MRPLPAFAGAALAFLALLVSPAAAAWRWERVAGLPANATIRDSGISMRPASGEGLLTSLAARTGAQYYTSTNGSSWSKVSNWWIHEVYMAGSGTAFALGQLARNHNESKPLDLLRWTKGKGWSVSLTPPKGAGAAGITNHRLAVTDNGATVFCLGKLLWKNGTILTTTGPGNKYTQHVWRYTAATNAWAIIYTGTYTDITSTKATRALMGKGGRPHTPALASLVASSGSALWAGWAGTDATGAKVGGRISLFNGTTWSLVRRGADNEYVTLTAVPPNQVWAHVRTSTGSSEVLYTGKQGVRKRASIPIEYAISAPSSKFALLAEHGTTATGSYALRLLRWDAPATGFTSMKSLALEPTVWKIGATSSKWAVVAMVKHDPIDFMLSSVDAQVWNGSTWAAVTNWKQATDASVYALVVLPDGKALVALAGPTRGYSLWRLVQ